MADLPRSEESAPVRTDVVIIGAGFGGVATAHNLRRRGVGKFVVLEQSDGLGGTWWDNRYPGAEVDVTSELYSLSFAPHVFGRTHAGQAEIQAYMEKVVDDHGLRPHFRFGRRVESVRWAEKTHTYLVTAADGGRWEARHVVSCVGQLNNPRYPDWPGLPEFHGPCFHTSRWDHSVDLAGKRVALVGTGSTSAQVLPPLAEKAGHTYLFQRQPGWVMPKPDRDYTPDEIERLAASRWLVRRRRLQAFAQLERMRRVARLGTRANRRMQALAEEYLRTAVPDAKLRAQLTPDYPYYGKRPVLTQYYYPALAREDVTLVPRAVERVTPTGVVDASGAETDIDVLILATGFQPSRFLATFEVTGRGGTRLRDAWGAEPKSMLGMMAVGFPDFYVTYGPNTNGGVLTFTLERQAEWIADAIAHAEKTGTSLETKPGPVEIMDRLLVRRNDSFVWSRTGNNYYTSESGRVVTQWPYSQKLYWLLTRLLRPALVCQATARRETRRAEPAPAASDLLGMDPARD
ncbi:NAD(P)/FAD-dependent oxidoreductase [Actinomadura vinacea]|uniref:NAD(P)/FAD-dependent oxidoreductase n=1 Tax=Actinomadura vinacea TaxID=115336 RepID=A0ABN3ISJ2_9ACTN